MLGAHRHSLGDLNIDASRLKFRSETREVLTNLFVHNDMDLYSLFCLAFENSIKSPFRIVGGRAAQI